MTLAVILFNVSLILSSVALQAQATPQSTQASQPANDSPSTQDQGNAQQPNPPASGAASPGLKPSEKSPASKGKGSRPSHKKKAPPSNCDPPAAASSASNSSGASTNAPAGTDDGKASAPTSAAGPTNCPPPKVIVRQGSTSEPSIQLVGGDATSHEGDAAKQMLAAADANLKKIEPAQLSSSQQDMVTQIRQFMDQSKKATADGDTEQARTLAWKAKTLSEELLSPPK